MIITTKTGLPAGAHTYRSCGDAYAAYATPTDMLSIFGSETKRVAITSLVLGLQSTAAALQTIDFVKRSTANSGGTPTAQTAVKLNSSSPAATAVVNIYGAAPTTGDSAGIVFISKVSSSTLTGGANNTLMGTQFPVSIVTPNSPIILNGAAQGLCINYRGAALTGGFAMSWNMEWVEF